MSYKISKKLCYCYKINNHLFYIPQTIERPSILPNWNVTTLSFLEKPKVATISNNTEVPSTTKVNIVESTQSIPQKTITITNVQNQKLQIIEDETTISLKNKDITDGFLTKLFNKKMNIDWTPFVCKLEKVTFNNKINRYIFYCNDGKKSFRVFPASQLFHLIKKDENGEAKIKKGDLIYVEYYSATKLEDSKPKIVIFTKIKKVI